MTYLPRFVIMWMAVLLSGFCCAIAMIIHGKDTVPDSTWQFIKKEIMWTGWIELRCSGYSVANINKLPICYKKYLGPDWKPKYSGAPTLISNHRSWTDVTIGVGHFCACFVAAQRVRSIPGVWRVTDLLQCIYVNRVGADAAASRAKVFEQIKEF